MLKGTSIPSQYVFVLIALSKFQGSQNNIVAV